MPKPSLQEGLGWCLSDNESSGGSSMISTERLAEIETAEKAATPGPWGCYNGWGPDRHGDMRALRIGPAESGDYMPGISASNSPPSDLRGKREDFEFVAIARTAVSELLAEVRRLQGELDAHPTPGDYSEICRSLLKAEARVAELEALVAEIYDYGCSQKFRRSIRIRVREAAANHRKRVGGAE